MLRVFTIVVTVLAALLAPGAPSLARNKKKPKVALTCVVTYSDGTRELLDGVEKVRVDGAPVTCMLLVTEMDDTAIWQGAVWTRYRGVDAETDKPADLDGPQQTGDVYYRADAFSSLLASFNPDTDYVGCHDFTVNASLTDPHGGTVWKGKLKVEQECPE